MTDTRDARIARIDEAIAGHRRLYMKAVFRGHDGEAEHHEWQVDRLLDLRNRVQRGWPKTTTTP
jgi:hypothetical protein